MLTQGVFFQSNDSIPICEEHKDKIQRLPATMRKLENVSSLEANKDSIDGQNDRNKYRKKKAQKQQQQQQRKTTLYAFKSELSRDSLCNQHFSRNNEQRAKKKGFKR